MGSFGRLMGSLLEAQGIRRNWRRQGALGWEMKAERDRKFFRCKCMMRRELERTWEL